MRLFISLLLPAVFVIPGMATPARALEIVIGGGVEQAVPLAVINFANTSGSVDPAEVIRNDLQRSGYFKVLENIDMPAAPTSPGQVDFADWRRIGVENLLLGEMSRESDGFKLRYYLLDVYRQEQLIAERVTSTDPRLAAHRISDSIVSALTGHGPGTYAGRMVFVSNSSTGANNSYFLNISDYDGYNARVLLDSPEPLLSPVFSPDGSSISYVAFESNGTTIYVQDIASGRRQRVSAWPGINGAPAYSPDGTRIAASLSRDGDPEIYLLHLASATWQRITNSPAIDTEPAWLPDGKSLVFTSDRSGRPHVYKVDIATGKTSRLTFDGEYNASPAVSPDGSTIATVNGDSRNFELALFVYTSGELIRTIRTVTPPETVDFSANGQLLLYSSGDRLGTVPVSGTPDIAIKIPGALKPRQASWGSRR